MPRGQVDDTSALESEIDRLVYPLGFVACLSKNYDIKYRMGDELNED